MNVADLSEPEPDAGSDTVAPPSVEVAAQRLVEGGEALSRESSGEIVFVRGALPGERVLVSAPRRRSGARRADLVEVLEASPDRREPPCEWVGAGCGGCDLQHLDTAAQRGVKAEVVRDALRRLGGIHDPLVELGGVLASVGFRTTVRAAVDGSGRAGFRRHRSHEVVVPEACMVAHPLVEELLVEGRFPGVEEVTLRVGAATGERVAVISAGDGAPAADRVSLPDDVAVVTAAELKAGRRVWFHEEVAGRTFRISARSFFQTRRDGAEDLVAAVREAAGDSLVPGVPWVDAYAGVGLLAGALTLGWPADALSRVQAVERSASSVADARVNLTGGIRVVRSDVDRWRASPCEVVVADPARSGLGRRGVDALVAAGAPLLVLVSCDAASLGRDAGLLWAAGYRFERSRLVDMFPHSHHLEAVSTFRRS